MDKELKKIHEYYTKKKEPIICATEEVFLVNGNAAECLAMLGVIARNLKNLGIESEDILKAVNIGLNPINVLEELCKKINKILKEEANNE